ncbi:DUF2637 domain-containing protein [Streptomyces virginiae]|uniref:DUF2637 domain-containing protein n=1 Tax=Streptomyces virginiae TaxID=1961 RepID=UPI0036BE430A
MPSFLSTYALPLGIAVAGLCAIVTVVLVLRSRRATEQSKLTDAQRAKLAQERRESWRRGLSVFALGVGCLMLFAIAGTAGWLSFAAQREYAHSRNGGSWEHATGFALLLDAGALGLSLFRFFEALTLRSSTMTRLFLFGFIGASSAMNYLHAPGNEGGSIDFGSRFVAVVPPLVYAVLLEMLLHKIEQVIMGKRPARKKLGEQRGYSLLLWLPWPIGSPVRMWRAWREDLLETIANVRAPGSRKPLPATVQPQTLEAEEPGKATWQEEPAPRPAAPSGVAGPAPSLTPQPGGPALTRVPAPSPQPRPQPAAPAVAAERAASPVPIAVTPSTVQAAAVPQHPAQPVATPVPLPQAPAENLSKKDLLREALMEQIRGGDLKVLDHAAQVSNGAAYKANQQLGRAAGKGKDQKGVQEGLLAPGAVRTTVKQLLPELRQFSEEVERARRAEAAAPPPAPEPAPEHRALPDDGAAGDGGASRDRGEQEEPVVIGHQRESEASVEERETALA